LITVHHDRIAINALKDEADKILECLKQEIKQAWKNREMTEPSLESFSKDLILDVLELLPRSNCQQCSQPTCMVFAILVADGAKGPEGCLALQDPHRPYLEKYLARFRLQRLFLLVRQPVTFPLSDPSYG
jgi:ArsR family metal-binding transcriptional regulator